MIKYTYIVESREDKYMESIYNFLIQVENDLQYGEHGIDTLLLFFIAFFLFGIFLTVFANGLGKK